MWARKYSKPDKKSNIKSSCKTEKNFTFRMIVSRSIWETIKLIFNIVSIIYISIYVLICLRFFLLFSFFNLFIAFILTCCEAHLLSKRRFKQLTCARICEFVRTSFRCVNYYNVIFFEANTWGWKNQFSCWQCCENVI